MIASVAWSRTAEREHEWVNGELEALSGGTPARDAPEPSVDAPRDLCDRTSVLAPSERGYPTRFHEAHMLAPPLIFLALNLAEAAPTLAACGTGDAPTQFSSGTCQVNNNPICRYRNGELTCDLDTLGCKDGFPTQQWAVRYNTSHTNAFTVFGACTGSSSQSPPPILYHCCKVTDAQAEITRVTLKGSSWQDEPIGFRWQHPTQSWNVRNLQPTGSQGLLAQVFARDGNDVVVGSDSAASHYDEELWGENGADTIYTHGGGGTAWGGNGSDHLYGGPGQDSLFGGADDDFLFGRAGDDRLHGGHGDDYLEGEGGNDVLYGSLGSDELFGGPDDDTICDTREPESFAPVVCPGDNYFSGGAGSNDRAFSYSYHFCDFSLPNALQGDQSVEDIRSAAGAFNWSAVIASGYTPSTNTTPWPECADLRAEGGP